jgi:hypothetical protein
MNLQANDDLGYQDTLLSFLVWKYLELVERKNLNWKIDSGPVSPESM